MRLMAAKKKPAAGSGVLGERRALIADLVSEFPSVEKRKMLQSEGWFTANKLFVFVSSRGEFILRLADPAAQEELLALPGARRWSFGNKPPMKDWLVVPAAIEKKPSALREWCERAHALAKEDGAKKSAPAKRAAKKRVKKK